MGHTNQSLPLCCLAGAQRQQPVEKSKSLDTLELGVFFLALQEALKSTALGSLLQGSPSPPESPALITQRVSITPKQQSGCTEKQTVPLSSWPPSTLRTSHITVTWLSHAMH